ncbi:MAG: polysaccharide deacetylase family protein [Deltaproteobacteria bacterium]|nr:polysaccharide deacetylase family protein [Deltaproteobacteria bacterium]MBN2671725.1 polysaccharide deacetylase family protein [Deltaproteobacteria bacterium]
MNHTRHTFFKLLICILLLVPMAGFGFGKLSDVQYKIKPQDGNRWSHLVGHGHIVRGTEAKGKITFTFDDGPDHRTTPTLLDQLDRYGVKGAFFVNGHRFHQRTAGGEENRAVLRDMVRRGHFIGNHTFSHKDVSQMDDDTWKREVHQVAFQVSEISGRNLNLFRPPFGRMNADNIRSLQAQGYTVVMWNLDPLDWQATTARQLLERSKRIIEENPDGGVFLLHDTNRNTAQAFPLIMEWIEERNARLAAEGKPGLEVVGIDKFIKN